MTETIYLSSLSNQSSNANGRLSQQNLAAGEWVHDQKRNLANFGTTTFLNLQFSRNNILQAGSF